MINPQLLIEKYTLAEHINFAEEYFSKLAGNIYLLQKPFYHPKACAPLVTNLGQLLEALDLSHGTRVLDFGAGTCWLSRILVQLGCRVTSCDVSETALSIGRELFERYPPIIENPLPHDFLHFNGETIDASRSSFDRIIVNDAFHHVPNQLQVLAEMYRVLTEDGVIAMSEPGRLHSSSEESQREMRIYNVIENDIVIEDLWHIAREVGFKDLSVCAVLRQSYMSINQYLECIHDKVPEHVIKQLKQDTFNHSLFMLRKTMRAREDDNSIIPKEVSQDEFDEVFYLTTYKDVANAIENGFFSNGWEHYELHGRIEKRRGSRD